MAKLTGITRIGTNRNDTQELPIQSGGGGNVVIDFPAWDSADAFDFEKVQKAYKSDLPRQQALTIESRESGSLTPPNTPKKAVLTPNNFLYFSPNGSSNFFKLNLANDSFTTLAANPGGSFDGWILARNGIIYGLSNAGHFVKLDPSTDTLTTITNIGSNTYIGIVEAPNGMIYGIPYNETQVLKFNPSTEVISYFGSLSGTAKWFGGGLGPNGIIYGAPFNSSNILKINTNDDTISVVGSISGSNKFINCSMAINGLMYFFPYNNTVSGSVDIRNDEYATLSSASLGTVAYQGGTYAQNGKFYLAPQNPQFIAIIDTYRKETYQRNPPLGVTTTKYWYPVFVPSGHIYFVNQVAAGILKYKVSNAESSMNFCLNPYFRTT
jgi:hypothetical protein